MLKLLSNTLVKNLLIPTIITLCMITGFIIKSPGLALIVTFVPGAVMAYILYLLTCYKKMPNPEKILPIYFLAIGIQLIHFAEEFTGEFYVAFPRLFNAPAFTPSLFVTVNMTGYAVFIMSGYAIYKKIKFLMVIPLFFVMYGILGNAIAHVVFAIVSNGYFPGLYTALLYWIISPIIIMQFWRETRVK